MEINAEKTKLMTTKTNGINMEIKVNGQKLETVISFSDLGSVVSDEGSKPEILSTIAQTTAALTRLKPVWNERSISLSSKIRLMRSFVTSIFLYACELQQSHNEEYSGNGNEVLPQDTAHFTQRLRFQRGSPCQDPVGNRTTRRASVTILKRRILKWYGHVSRSSGLAKTILKGTMKGGRRQGRQKKRWEDNISEWTGLEFAKSQRAIENRKIWRKLVVK